MFELDRFHSQTLTQFGSRKLARSLSGVAGEIRTHVLDGVNSERNRSMSFEHLIAKNSAAVKRPKRLGSLPKSGRSKQPARGCRP